MNLPRDFERWNKALQGSFKKGVQAHKDGKSIKDCPYADVRKNDGRITWSRSFRAVWRDGFLWSQEDHA